MFFATKLLLAGAFAVVLLAKCAMACPYHTRLNQLKSRYKARLDALEGAEKEAELTRLRERAFREARRYLNPYYTNYKMLHPDLFDRYGNRIVKTSTEQVDGQTQPKHHQHHSSVTRPQPQQQHHQKSTLEHPKTTSVPTVNGHGSSHQQGQKPPRRSHSQTIADTRPQTSYRRRTYTYRRPVVSRVQPQADRNQYYRGSLVFQPEQHVACPNTRVYYCPLGNECIYSFGRYRCRPINQIKVSCEPGYQRVNVSETQYRCVDINECDDEDLNTCEDICINVRGSFRCKCQDGYDVQTDGSCLDKDECVSKFRYCQHECVNTAGSYQCVCPEGYMLNHTLRTCKDINECNDENICEEDQRCLNTYGGHECYAPEPCKAGYTKSGGGSGPCVIDDYNPRNWRDPVSISENRFALHSGYPPFKTVATMSFVKRPRHYYRFRVLEGGLYFRIIYNQASNYFRIMTNRRLNGPVTHKLSINVIDRDLIRRSYTISKLDIFFVVSEYSF